MVTALALLVVASFGFGFAALAQAFFKGSEGGLFFGLCSLVIGCIGLIGIVAVVESERVDVERRSAQDQFGLEISGEFPDSFSAKMPGSDEVLECSVTKDGKVLVCDGAALGELSDPIG